jgi:hypothetical protein
VVRERLPYVNFEDERLAGLHADQLHLLLEEYFRRFPALRGSESVTWCLDEIQVVPGWERFVRRMLDSENVGRCTDEGAAIPRRSRGRISEGDQAAPDAHRRRRAR